MRPAASRTRAGMRDETNPLQSEVIMPRQDLRERTKAYALRIIRLYAALPKTTEAQVIGKQVLRSGTSVGAHYREAWRAKSDADFISKMEGGLQELDETAYWLEIISDLNWAYLNLIEKSLKEANELLAIFTSIGKKLKR